MSNFWLVRVEGQELTSQKPIAKKMGNLKKELTKMGVSDNVVRNRMLEFVKFECKHLNEEQTLQLLRDIVGHPENYMNHPSLRYRALAGLLRPVEETVRHYELLDHPLPYPAFGRDMTDPLAIRQMDTAMRLPVTVAGALMPDAHAGHLPAHGSERDGFRRAVAAAQQAVGERAAADAPRRRPRGRASPARARRLDEPQHARAGESGEEVQGGIVS